MLSKFDKDSAHKLLERINGKTVKIRSYNTTRTGKVVGIHSEFFMITGLVSYVVEFSGGSREIMFPNEITMIGENSKNQLKRTSGQ